MKKALSFLSGALLLGIVALSSCKTDDTDNISIVRTYPSITLNGVPALSVNVGDTYTDAGVVAKLGSTPVTARVTGSVNTATAGVYTITYTAKNPEGDSISTSRIVGVVDPAVNSLDLSGVYKRSSNNVAVNVTKLGNGFYQTDNFGGVPPPSAAILPAYFFHLTPTTVEFPAQNVPGAGGVDFTGDQSVFNGSDIVNYSYVVVNPGFGTARRTFVKQ